MCYRNPKWPEGVQIKRDNWHFHKRLYERYGIILLPGEYTKILNKIKSGELEPIFYYDRNGLNTFKYVHEEGTPNQRRIYIVADPAGTVLVSVQLPEWVDERLERTRRLKNKAKKKREAQALVPA